MILILFFRFLWLLGWMSQEHGKCLRWVHIMYCMHLYFLFFFFFNMNSKWLVKLKSRRNFDEKALFGAEPYFWRRSCSIFFFFWHIQQSGHIICFSSRIVLQAIITDTLVVTGESLLMLSIKILISLLLMLTSYIHCCITFIYHTESLYMCCHIALKKN